MITSTFMQNLKRSIRRFFYQSAPTWTWFLDAVNENIDVDSFAILKSSTRLFEDPVMPYSEDMINLNIFDKEQATHESRVATAYAALKDRVIPVLDLLSGEPGTLLGRVRVTGVEVTNIGNTNGYYQTNLGIFVQIIE